MIKYDETTMIDAMKLNPKILILMGEFVRQMLRIH